MATKRHPVDVQDLPAPSVAGTGEPFSQRRSVRIKKRDVRRAVEGVQATGLQIASVRIEPDVTILIVPGAPAPVPSAT